MNRNTELHFSHTPQIEVKRSRFEESHSHKTTGNVGDIIPIYVDSDILPGDTVQMDMASLIRMATPIYPTLDNLYADFYFFFVPHRLVYEHWAEFWGENDDPWIQQVEHEIPQITAPQGGWTEGTIADYMGVPTKVSNISINALPFRAYAKCVNDWFRDENLKKCCNIYKDETTRQGVNTANYVTDPELGGKPVKAAKMHDYLTSALPAPQKGPAIEVPIGGSAPITGTLNTLFTGNIPVSTLLSNPYITHENDGTRDSVRLTVNGSIGTITETPLYAAKDGNFFYQVGKNGNTLLNVIPNNLKLGNVSASGTISKDTLNNNLSTTQNLVADLASATAVTINALRTAFAIQKYYENAGLHGTRYIEYIRSVFGVTSSDARFQRAEYLGGERVGIQMSQIIQTSSTNATSPQGNTSGFSCTHNSQHCFIKSFEEHGTLLGLMVIRTEHTYQQGLSKMWTRKKWTDFYNPFFANLGEMPILNENIYAQGTAEDKEAFGYQEAWAEYRYKENRVSGYMRSNADGTLDAWHYADYYTALPVLGETWIDEPLENVDRTIAITSQLTHQFIMDFYFNVDYTRPMPVYSIPGLIDHV